MRTRKIKVDMLARVEGEGSLSVKITGDKKIDVELGIFEPPRFFEAFMVGRRHDEAPDITARICGICPIAYQISSSTAMEDALGIEVGGQLRELRRLIYCGEWIESHALHIHLLHAPDFLGYQDAIQMAGDHPHEVKRGLFIKKIGNHLMSVVGGREIHPINIKIGGFYSVPTKAKLEALLPDLEKALDEAVDAALWTARLKMPDFEPETEFVSLVHPDEYPLFGGRLASTEGLDIPLRAFLDEFMEVHEKHSHALHGRKKNGGCYQVGPIARLNLNRGKLHPKAAQLADDLLPERQVVNPFKSIIVRAVETVYALEEAIRIIKAYEPPAEPCLDYKVKRGYGVGCSEAPRGICWHGYEIDEKGDIASARIVPPTSQNQPRIEQDLREMIPGLLHMEDHDLRWRCEQAIRNYDPCISCATHFVRLNIERPS